MNSVLDICLHRSLRGLAAARLTLLLRVLNASLRVASSPRATDSRLLKAAQSLVADGRSPAAWRVLRLVRQEFRATDGWADLAAATLADLEDWQELEKSLPPLRAALQLASHGQVEPALAAWQRAVEDDLLEDGTRIALLLSSAEGLVTVFDAADEREAASQVVDSLRNALNTSAPQRLTWLTRLCFRTSRPRYAAQAAEDLVANRPTALNMALLADAYQRSRRYDDALDVLDRATTLDPSLAAAHAARADALYIENRFPEAIEAYELALASDERPRWLAKLGKALLHAGRDADALAAFQRSATLRTSVQDENWVERLEVRLGHRPRDFRPADGEPTRIFDHMVDLVDVGAVDEATAQLTSWLRHPPSKDVT